MSEGLALLKSKWRDIPSGEETPRIGKIEMDGGGREHEGFLGVEWNFLSPLYTEAIGFFVALDVLI